MNNWRDSGAARLLGLTVVAATTSPTLAQCPAQWLPPLGVPDLSGGSVDAVVEWDPDGAGPLPSLLVVGGYFDMAGGASTPGVAAWNGAAWQTFGSGPPGGGVTSLAVYNGELFAGGNQIPVAGGGAASVVRWDGAQWQAVGQAPNGTVRCLTVFNGELVVGGSFAMAGGASANNIARWNGTIWRPLGSGVTGMHAMTVYNFTLVVAGPSAAGGLPVNGVASWNGVTWQAMGAEYVSPNAFLLFNNSLIVGSQYLLPGGSVGYGMLQWTGTAWLPMGAGSVGAPDALVSYHGQIIGAVLMGTAGNYSRLATWDGNTWVPILPGPNGGVTSMLVRGDELFVAGGFTAAGGQNSHGIAHWHGPTTCRADFDCSYSLTVQDIFDFLNAWIAGNPRADFNGGGLSVQDIFDFLNAWLAGCN